MQTTLFAILYVSLASITTIHVLSYKRDIRASIGWIGITWFSPFVGSLMYYIFGINRVARRAGQFRHNKLVPGTLENNSKFGVSESAVAGSNIETVGNRVSNHRPTSGNVIKILQHGDETYPLMLDAIRNAKRSIALSTYIFQLDAVGNAFFDALALAKKRGVEIRVLVDGIGSGFFFSPIVRRLKEAGIKAYPFMDGWSLRRLAFLNLRNHKKLLIVDCETGFVGGMNLSSKNVLGTRKEPLVRDTHFHVQGPLVAQLMESFSEDLRFTSDESLNPDVWSSDLHEGDAGRARCINSGPDEDMGDIEAMLAIAISTAKHRIRIVTPYFLPSERLKFLLELAAMRGVEVDLITPERADLFLIDWAVSGYFSRMKIDLINCFRSPRPFDHSKLFTIDDTWCAFGSFNWDIRSLRLNFEVMVECYDREIVSKINDLIEQKKTSAKRLSGTDVDARNTFSKLRDSAARLLVPYL